MTADKLAAGVAWPVRAHRREAERDRAADRRRSNRPKDARQQRGIVARAGRGRAGSTDQSTSDGTGVKTRHLADQAVTQPKLAAGAVSFDKLATKAVFDAQVTVPGSTQGGGPGVRAVAFETVAAGETALYLVSVNMFRASTIVPVQSVQWTRFAVVDQAGIQENGIVLQNSQPLNVDVRCVASGWYEAGAVMRGPSCTIATERSAPRSRSS